MERHLKPFEVCTEEARLLIDMAFSKKKADDRKEWLRSFQPGTFMDHRVEEIPMDDFINKELILFSMADNCRSIPSSVDGLKPGQRKILFSCFKRNLKSEIKVAQLAGYVSEHSAYHHGEQSLSSTIVGMAQTYVGSNNLPLLEPLGQFGTRLQGGKDAASPRYIFTNLALLTRAVYHPSDDPLLNYLNDDGQNIEPEWYIPVVPMILINGGEGIGTGWSTSIPNYNPRDIVANLYRLMDGEETLEMTPWYRGFAGTIVNEAKDKFRVTGIIKKIDSTTVEITELPLRSWTQVYKEQLEAWVTGTEKSAAWIKDYREHHTDSKVHFVVTLTEESLREAEKEGLEKKFKMTSSVSTSNLVCFDLEGRIRKYENVDEILKNFFDLRKEYYYKRKEQMLAQLTHELTRCENKVRFVKEIISGTLIVSNRKKTDLLADLKSRKYDPIYKNDDQEEKASDHGYDYLLSMPIWNLTMEKIDSLLKEKSEKESQVKILIDQTILDLWRTDIDSFLARWDEFETAINSLESQEPNNKSQAMKKSKTAVAQMLKKPKKKSAESDDTMGSSEDDFDVKPTKKAAPKKKEAVMAKKPALVKTEMEPKMKAAPKQNKVKSESESEASDMSASFASPVKVAKNEPKKKAPVTSKQMKLDFSKGLFNLIQLQNLPRKGNPPVVLMNPLSRKGHLGPAKPFYPGQK